MTYRALHIPEGTPELISRVVSESLDPRLWDVHAMLRLPLVREGIEAAGNFAIADVLFGVIDGVSAVLYPRYHQPHDGFVKCVTDHYKPDSVEPVAGLPADRIAAELWNKFRNPMQHCLGLALGAPDRQGIRPALRLTHGLMVMRDCAPMTEKEVESLEHTGWPPRLTRPTLQYQDGQLILSVEALYVGTRRLIGSILSSHVEVDLARRALSDLFVSQHFPAPVSTVSSSVSYTVSVNSVAAMDSWLLRDGHDD